MNDDRLKMKFHLVSARINALKTHNANENKTQHNLKWSYIPDHPYRILIIGGSGSGKTNALLNLINNQPGIN